MQPSSTAGEMPRNAPHDLLARLYREIGVSAVAAALGLPVEASPTRQSAEDARAALAKKAA